MWRRDNRHTWSLLIGFTFCPDCTILEPNRKLVFVTFHFCYSSLNREARRYIRDHKLTLHHNHRHKKRHDNWVYVWRWRVTLPQCRFSCGLLRERACVWRGPCFGGTRLDWLRVFWVLLALSHLALSFALFVWHFDFIRFLLLRGPCCLFRVNSSVFVWQPPKQSQQQQLSLARKLVCLYFYTNCYYYYYYYYSLFSACVFARPSSATYARR